MCSAFVQNNLVQEGFCSYVDNSFCGTCLNKHGPNSAWASLYSNILNAIKGFLEEWDGDADDGLQLTETLQLLNRNWCQWATKATSMLNPMGTHVQLEELVDMISQKCVNVNTLHLYKMKITNDGLSSLSTLPNLTHLSLSGGSDITDEGLGY